MTGKRWIVLGSTITISFLFLFWTGNVFNSRISESKPTLGRHTDEPAPEQKPGVKELTIQVAMKPKEYAELVQLKQQFQFVHSDTLIKLENVTYDTAYSRWKKAAQLGDAPDVMLLDNSWVTEFAALGYLMPVDSLLTSELLSQQMEQVVNQGKWNGYMWGVPKDVDMYVMVYSLKRLAELGLDKPPAQAEDLLALHYASSKPNEGKYGLYLDLEDPLAFIALIKSLGGEKAQGKSAPLKFSDPAVTKTLEPFFTAPSEVGKEEVGGLSKLFPSSSVPSWNPWEMLQQGRMAGMVTTLSDYKLHAADGLVMAAMPLPKVETIWKSSWLAGRSFVISSRTDYRQEAFEWIRDMTNVGSSVKLWNEGFKLPSTLNSYFIGGIKLDPVVQSVTAYFDKEDGLVKSPAYNKQLQQLSAGLMQLWRGDINWKSFSEQTETQWK